ncbi:MAG: hypothetical protein WCT18_03850, partial [Patescibacteria group bacterium]
SQWLFWVQMQMDFAVSHLFESHSVFFPVQGSPTFFLAAPKAVFKFNKKQNKKIKNSTRKILLGIVFIW